jgi:putative membrane protein
MLLLRWLLNTLVLLLVGNLVPGVKFASFWSALIASLVLGLLNALIRPLIILLTLPVNILTLGLFTLIINALMFWLASSIVKGFEISNFAAAFWGALVYTLIVMLIGLIEKR